jgi:hypothetical protein
MRTIPVTVPPEFWSLSCLPEGFIERWLETDATKVNMGAPLAVVRVEGLGHKLVAPASGVLKIEAKVNSVVDPGMRVGEIFPHLDG